MSDALNIRVDQKSLRGVKLVLSGVRNGYPKALLRATNRTVVATKTAMSTEARAILNLRKSDVDKKIQVKKATTKDPNAYVKRSGKPISLTTFIGTRQLKKGVSAKIKKDSKRSVIPHAFIATSKKARQAFRRAKPPYRVPVNQLPKNYQAYFAGLGKKDEKKFPIERLTGPRVEDIISKTSIIARIQAKASETFDKNIAQQTKFLLGKLK